MGNFWTTEPVKGEPKFVVGQAVRRKDYKGIFIITDIREFEVYDKEHKCWYYYESKSKNTGNFVLDYESRYIAIDNGVTEMLNKEFNKLFD